jgi:hypothetical protein
MKPHLVIFIIVSSFISISSVENSTAEPVLNLVYPERITQDVEAVFVCGEFALIKKADADRLNIQSHEIFPQVSGDYYVMRILDRQKLGELDEILPYVLIGQHAIFKTDPAGAEILSNYGWGLTRITYSKKIDRPYPAPDIVLEYDPDIAAMISEITVSSCQSAITPVTSFSTRYSYSAICRLAEEYAINRYNDFSLQASYFDFSWYGTDMRNVIGQLTGTVAPESVVIVCAHLDCTSDDPYNDAPGAEDNGSGTSAVLEAARILSQYQSELTIRFITFSGEEQGLVGSDEYADSMVTAGENIVAVINLDMVAYRGQYAKDMYIYSDQQSHWLGSLAAEVMATYTNVDTVTHYETNPRYGSDHYSFAVRGYPAMFFIDAWDGPDWYPYYHTTGDTLGNLDMDLLASVTQTGTAMAAILARVDLGANPDPIPTLSEWGMITLALLLLAFGTIAIIRRRNSLAEDATG